MISIPSILQALWIIVSFGGNPVTLNMQETQDFHMRTAWNANGQIIRFVPFAASDVMVREASRLWPTAGRRLRARGLGSGTDLRIRQETSSMTSTSSTAGRR